MVGQDSERPNAWQMRAAWKHAVCELSPQLASTFTAEDPNISALAWSEQSKVAPNVELKALSQLIGITFVDSLRDRIPSNEFLERFPIAYSRQHGLIGLSGPNDDVVVALGNVRSWPQLDVVRRFLGRPIEPLLAPAAEIQTKINDAYQQRSGQAQTLIDSLDRDKILAELEQLDGREDLLDVAGRSPVIKLVNLVLFEAVSGRASDVHIQPYEDRLIVRMRIDGVLFDAFDVPKTLQEEVISRIKIVGRMNIAEKRLPQDGRATVQVGDRIVDLRIASLPASHGERVVIRLLDKSARLYSLGELGMDGVTLERFQRLVHLEHGLILVTGPTGSGKSTTLYGALQEINAKDFNIVTLEDPIEYQIDGVSQTQINEKKGMTFASGLRNVLRQDPDIIMIGEIRDHETAVMAIQSALTGHLVFSTLHTNDAASAVTRLLDLGIEPYLVSSSLMAVMAQRLVRTLCNSCASPRQLTDEDIKELGVDGLQLSGREARSAVGCSQCRQTGYKGRLGIFELLIVDDPLRKLIQDRANAAEIRNEAMLRGLRLLREDAIDKVLAGGTTVDEVSKATMRSSF